MIEDHLRKNHDPTPSEDERDWLQGNFYARLARATLMIIYAVVMGVSTSVILERNGVVPTSSYVGVSNPGG